MKLHNLGINQTEISFKTGSLFFSYQTCVACCINGKYFRTSEKWSKTTSKHINNYLGDIKAEEKDQSFFEGLLDAVHFGNKE